MSQWTYRTRVIISKEFSFGLRPSAGGTVVQWFCHLTAGVIHGPAAPHKWPQDSWGRLSIAALILN